MRARAGTSAVLRRAHLCFAAMWAGEAAFMVALAVVAFAQGGVAAVGVVTAVRMASAALLSPALATVADRVRRERVLTTIGVVRAAALAAAAATTWAGGPPVATYGCAVVATVALALFRPAHSALLPALARTPAELTTANAVRGLLDSAATLGGPVVATALLATTGPAAVFAVCAALSLVAGLVVASLPYDAPPRAAATPARTPGRDMVEGFATIVADRGLALVTGLGVVQTFTRGALTVLSVAVAIDLLRTGQAGVGVLSAAVGAGGVVGSAVAFRLVRRGGLGSWFGVGVATFGAPLALLGLAPAEGAAIGLLGLVGVGNALIDVAGFTVLARLTDERVLARMFAGFEAVLTLGVAVGGLAAPLAVSTLGLRPALVAVGVLAPAAVLLTLPALRRLDGRLRVRDADVATLQAVPMLAVLPAATVEQLAAGLTRLRVPAGRPVVEQGAVGDAYYVVVSGHPEVLRDGRLVATLGPGDGFGEIALLGDVPRTATVRAPGSGPLEVAVLGRSSFLTAVTGYPASAAAGAEVVQRIRTRNAASDPPG